MPKQKIFSNEKEYFKGLYTKDEIDKEFERM